MIAGLSKLPGKALRVFKKQMALGMHGTSFRMGVDKVSLRKTVKKLSMTPELQVAALRQALYDVGEMILKEAKERAPVFNPDRKVQWKRSYMRKKYKHIAVNFPNLRESAYILSILRRDLPENKVWRENEGAIKESERNVRASEANGLVRVELGFSANYALAVHERLDLRHDEGEAKFLETATKSAKRKIVSLIRARMRSILRKGTSVRMSLVTVADMRRQERLFTTMMGGLK